MAKHFKRFLIWWFPVILYCLFIFIQSAFPSPVRTPGVPLGDKLLHLTGYALLAALVFRAMNATRPGPAGRLWTMSVLFAALYGALDEVHQAFVPSRTADVLDLLADAAGAAIGAGAALWITARKARPPRKNDGLTNPPSSYN